MQLTDKHFIDWEGEVFGYGYGTGEQYTIPALHTFFSTLKDGRSYDHRDLEEKLGPLGAWMLISALCKGPTSIISYGSSPRYGWIDYVPAIEALRDYIVARTPGQLYGIVTGYDDTYIRCYRDFCNCDIPCLNPLLGHTTETPSYREINNASSIAARSASIVVPATGPAN